MVAETPSLTFTYKENETQHDESIVTNKPITGTAGITVLFAIPNSISITTRPTKTTYNGGQVFRPEGMVVTGYFGSTNKPREIPLYIYPRELLKQGQTAVIISHTSRGVTRTVNCPVTVNEQKAVFEKYTTGNKTEYSNFRAHTVKDTWTSNSLQTSVRLYRSVEFSTEKGMIGVSEFFGSSGGYLLLNINSAYYMTSIVRNNWNGTIGYFNGGYSCINKQVESKGSYIADVTASKSSFPSNGKGSDGNWYVLKNLITEELPTLGKAAQAPPQPDCLTCEGTGVQREKCQMCLGTGKHQSEKCALGDACDICKSATNICPQCNGTGDGLVIKCKDCKGTGKWIK